MAKIERESINFKLPKPLADALRAAAKERNTTATDLVIQGLHHILGDINGVDIDVETRLHRLESQFTANQQNAQQIQGVDDSSQQRLEKLEQKMEAIANRLAQLEGAIAILNQRSATGSRRQSYNYHPPQHELQAYTGENLAKRLGVDFTTLQREQSNQTPKDFERWCRSRDPSSLAWRRSDNGLYHPVK
jgi:predicted  nucleic acid-binding Zn-ribbon protein